MNYKRNTKKSLQIFLFPTKRREGKIQNLNDSLELQMFYKHTNGELWLGDSIKWLKTLDSESIDLIFADPPYNIKKAKWDNFKSQEQYIDWSMKWIIEANRVLKKTGSLFVCGFSEILADIKHPTSKYFKYCRWIIWHYKNKANLGKDWGRSHESILHFRKSKSFTFNIDSIRIPYSKHTLKYPVHPQSETSQYGNGKNSKHIWQPNPLGAKPKDVIEIPTTCNGMHEKTPHPTQKPEELLRKIILASSNEGDVILDPFCGSGTTPVCAEQLNRKWLVCDLSKEYLIILKTIKSINKKDASIRKILNNETYTIQQSIGAALDALPSGKANTSRKLNGDLFENFIRIIISEIGLNCYSGVVQVPIIVEGKKTFDMSYQQDLIIKDRDEIKMIGSVKTTSKDSIDKIFIDKFLYNKLTEKQIPHIAIFLNDVQKKKKKENEYGINATFLPGHFKGYTVKLNPLDGVYYCDIRPNMLTEDILKDFIKTFDNLLITDIWNFV